MTVFEWQASYEIGDDTIDQQHRQLLDLAFQLHAALVHGKQQAILKPAFEALLAYTRQHFSDEERFFESCGSSRLSEHREQHRVLEEEVLSLWQEDAMGLDEGIGEQLEEWVRTRLVHHMTVDDRAAADACRHSPT